MASESLCLVLISELFSFVFCVCVGGGGGGNKNTSRVVEGSIYLLPVCSVLLDFLFLGWGVGFFVGGGEGE